jgi:hypothetical protein
MNSCGNNDGLQYSFLETFSIVVGNKNDGEFKERIREVILYNPTNA